MEASANATAYAIALPEEFESRLSPEEWSAGVSAALGLTDRANLLANYQHSRFADAEVSDGESPFEARDDRFALGFKYGWDPMREAFAFAYGFHPAGELHELAVSHFSNLYWKRGLYYCFSPTLALYTTGDWGRDEWFPNVVLNQSVTWEPARHVFLRPQVGINALALFARILIVNAGMAAGASF